MEEDIDAHENGRAKSPVEDHKNIMKLDLS